MNTIKLAQIGAGYWGANLVRNFVETNGIGEFIICDTDKGRLKKMERSFRGNVSTSSDPESIVNDISIHAVVIALPAAMHYTWARKSLLKGKHVLVEKPFCMNTDEARELIEINKKQKKVLMVGHTFLYNAAVRLIKKYIADGTLGDIYYVFSQRLNLGKVRDDVNVVWNLAPHDISIINYWFDEVPAHVQAKGLTFLQPGIADVAFLNLDYPSGKSAHIHVSWLDPSKTRKMVIVGSKKMLVYDDVSSDAKVTLYDKGIDKKNIIRELPDIESFSQFQLMHRTGDITIPKINFEEPLGVECQHFVDCILGNKQPITDEVHAAGVVKVLEMIDNAMKN